MKKILLLGAGRSSSACIAYLIKNAPANDWTITVADSSESMAKEKVGSSPYAEAVSFALENKEACQRMISQSDVVISLVPASFHPAVATLCLAEKKHLLTASYVSEEMKSLHGEAKSKGILLLNECGLDPGIDHMSAMKVIDRIKSEGGHLHSFESFTGGLIAPETDPENPWRYKFTWNPRNVVLAGQGTAKFLQQGQYKYIPYQQLFVRTIPISVQGAGEYEGYANRDSLKYRDAYGLQECNTVIRGTLRNKGYCGAWNVLANLGCCDDSYLLDDLQVMTHKDFISLFLDTDKDVENVLCRHFHIAMQGEEMKRLRWSGLFTEEKIGLEKGTPAQVLEHILNKKWRLKRGDKDFIVMWHRFKYELQGKQKETRAWLTAMGEDEVQTAMAKTVGLPLAIACKLLLTGKISSRGVVIPLQKEIYQPVLNELNLLGIGLEETESFI